MENQNISFQSLSLSTLSRNEVYHLMTSMVVPRPIAVVSTIDEKGRDNLAPFSYFNVVSSDPACLMFSVGKKRDGSKKDTLINIEITRDFVIHLATVPQQTLVEGAGEILDYGISEREKLGLTLTPAHWVKTPRVKEFKLAFECTLMQTLEIGSNTLIFGKVVGVHFDQSLQLPGEIKIDSYLLNPLARMARDYGKTAKVIPVSSKAP